MEYASPIWSHSSVTSRARLDKVQAKAAKIMSGAVSSTNNSRIQEECGLVPLEERRQMLTIKFTNNAHCLEEGHISHRTVTNWNKISRLKRSSPLLFDNAIREKIHLKPDDVSYRKETPVIGVVPDNTTICLELIEPCSKKDPKNKLKELGIKTIDTLSNLHHIRAFTDGSSDSTLTNGGAGVILLLPDDKRKEIAAGAGKIASNFTGELTAISTAIEAYAKLTPSQQLSGITIFSDCRSALQAIQKGISSLVLNILEQLRQLQRLQKMCFLQWIPAHVDLEFNEIADSLAKKARDLNQNATLITLADANAFAKSRLFPTFKIKAHCQVTNLDIDRKTSTTLIRLRTKHHKNMKISADGTRKYQNCDNCIGEELTPLHAFNCPAVAAGLHLLNNPTEEDLYSHDAIAIAKAIQAHHSL